MLEESGKQDELALKNMSFGNESLIGESTAGPGGLLSLSVPVIGQYSTRSLGQELGSFV